MKRITSALLALVVVASPLYAAPNEDSAAVNGAGGVNPFCVRNDSGATTFTSANGDYSNVACSNKGELLVASSSGSLPASQTEDVAHSTGASGIMSLGVRQGGTSTPTTFTDASGDYTPFGLSLYGDPFCELNAIHRADTDLSAIKREDEAFTDADALIMMGGRVRDSSHSGTVGANDDIAPPLLNSYGGMQVDQNMDAVPASLIDTSTGKLEDRASADADGGMAVLIVREDTPTATAGTSGDYTNPKANNLGVAFSDPAHAEAAYVYAATAFGSIGAGYATALTNTNKLRIIKYFNDTDGDVLLSFDASTDHMFIEAGERGFIDLGAQGRHESSNISVKDSTSTTTGNLHLTGIY